MSSLNVAIIGGGNMGRHHARVFSELKGVNLVGVCDTDETRAKALADKYGATPYTDYDAMFQKEDIDAVSVAVPTFLHHKVAMDVLEHGAHILLEKPIAATLEEAQEIIDAAREKQKTLMVGHIERFNPAVRRLRELVDAGRIGDIVSINIKRVGGIPPQTKNANVIMDLAIHDIDISNSLLGEYPTKVLGHKTKNRVADQEDTAHILLNYPKASTFIEVNWVTPVKIRTLDITGTKAFARLNYALQELTLYENSYLHEDARYNDFNEFVTKFNLTDDIKIGVNKDEPLKLELEEFIAAIKEEREPHVTPEQAYKSLESALSI